MKINYLDIQKILKSLNGEKSIKFLEFEHTDEGINVYFMAEEEHRKYKEKEAEEIEAEENGYY